MFSYFQQFIEGINTTSVVLIISSFFFLLGSIFFFEKKRKLALWLLFLTALLLGFAFATIDTYLHLWDEQYHALVAKNLAESPLTPRLYPEAPLAFNHEIWVANHVWLHKPPLSLWQIALSIKLFGVNYLAVRLPSILMHALLVFIIYRMGKILYTEKVGFVAAIVFTFLHYPLELTAGFYTSEHIDIAFMFYITLSLWSWLEYNDTKQLKWIILMGVFSGAAILTKWLVGLLAYAGAGFIQVIFREKRSSVLEWKRFFLAIGITVFVVVPWHIYAFSAFPIEYSHEMAYNTAHFYSAIEHHAGNFLYYWDNLNALYGNGDLIQWIILSSVVSIPILIKNRIYTVFLMIVILMPYLFFTLAATKMMSFCVIVAPVIVLVTVGLLIGLLNKIPKLGKLPNKRIFEGFVLLMMAIFLLRPKEAMINHKLDTEESRLTRTVYEEVHKAIQQLPLDENKNYALSNANKLLEEKVLWMFYKNNVIAYEVLFSVDDQKQLLDLGYTIKKIEWNGNTPVLLDY